MDRIRLDPTYIYNNCFPAGVYMIINEINGRFFIGATNNLKRRFKEHRSKLNHCCHDNFLVQSDYNLGHTFLFNVIQIHFDEDVSLELMMEEKQCLLDKERLNSPDLIYNISEKAHGGFGKFENHCSFTDNKEKLPKELFRYINYAISLGVTCRKTAKMLGVGLNIVTSIKNKKHWSNKVYSS